MINPAIEINQLQQILPAREGRQNCCVSVRVVTLVVWIAFVVEGLDVGVLANVGVGNGYVLNESLVIFATNVADIHQQVGIFDGRDDNTEDTESYACACRIDVVDDVGSTVEQVGIDSQLVELLAGLPLLFVELSRVSVGKEVTDVSYIVVDEVALDTVVSNKTLLDIVLHLPAYHALRGACDGCEDEQNAGDGCQNDNLAQTGVTELLPRSLFLVSVTVKLFHMF